MPDYSLYLVTDRGLSLGRDTADIVRAAVAGGVTCVQLREKSCGTREFVREARAVRDILAGTGVPLIINDRVDVALAVGADGVEDAVRAQAEGADYIGVSPVFATPTKTDTAPPLGLAGVAAIRAAVSLPVVGIGGIGPANAAEVIRAGCDGIAVVSAIVSAADPERAAAELLTIIRKTREES